MELLATHPAGAVGSPAVRLGVLPQESVAVEGITTNSAAEDLRRPLVELLLHLSLAIILSMDRQVLQKKLVLAESQPADWTRPLAAVDLPVAPERSGPREALPTDAAAVRFLSGVAPHVCLHVLEGLSTDATRAPATAAAFWLRPEVV